MACPPGVHPEAGQVLRLIRRYLEAGVMDGGLVAASEEGTLGAVYAQLRISTI
ncbi:MAG TPA: hypothetical protein VE197_05690 [Mycobacterium sp.]|nr:hypothetical protein [Mycobacterium sp.]